MNATPLCPVHQQPMRYNDKWGWSCSAFVGEGQPGANARGYCSQKGPRVQTQPAGPAPARPSTGSVMNHPRREPLIYAQCAVKAAFDHTADTDAAKRLAVEMFHAFQRVEKGGPLTFSAPQVSGPVTNDGGDPGPGDDYFERMTQ